MNAYSDYLATSVSRALGKAGADISDVVAHFEKKFFGAGNSDAADAVAALQKAIFDKGEAEVLKHSNSPNQIKIIFNWMEALTAVVQAHAAGATAAAAAAPNAAVAPHSSSSSVHSDALFFPSEKSLEKFVALLASAKKSMDICVFTITYDKIANTLIKAHKNGVKIRVITDNDKAADVGSDIGRMAAAGIPTVTDHTSFHMHNKFVIIDHQILINGSFNWTRSASDSNNENVIISDDPVLIRKFDAEFERLWKLFHNEEQASS